MKDFTPTEHFIDDALIIVTCDLSEDEKNVEKVKLLDARKAALGSYYADFPPWSRF